MKLTIHDVSYNNILYIIISVIVINVHTLLFLLLLLFEHSCFNVI
jgi:hypothetical protein